MLEEPGPGPLYEGCTTTVMPREEQRDEEARRRDRNELFPGWRERLERR